ncbi:60Kd inner membrane protein-domain-containing protein [Xylariaceae sp. FL0016]|nr:60Kd inner membrane protein-domain-containing protein [Xylariaceae sp. FL0016]
MLPSRGLSKAGAASALRSSMSSRCIPARHFSHARATSLLSKDGFSQSSQATYRAHLPELANVGIASSVFAHRAGASRNLSLWPFSSQQAPPTPSPTETLHDAAASAAPAVSSAPTSNAQPSTTPVQNDVLASVPSPADSSLSEISTDPFSNLDISNILDMPERIGYLKNLGLDFGWGPTACAEWLLEHIYVYTGMPWWAALATVAVAFRVVMFHPTLVGSKHQFLLQSLTKNPEFVQAKAEYSEAVARKDQMGMLMGQQKMKSIMASTGASFWRPMIGFLTVPFSFGMFRLFRAMAAIPVPSLETGGLAWFTDLTVHDPLYILPMLNVGLGVVMMRRMQAANPNQTAQSMAMGKMIVYIMPPLLFLGTMWIPAGLQFFFVLISASGILQAEATLNPTIRRAYGLPPIGPKPEPTVDANSAAKTWQAPVSRLRSDVEVLNKGVRETFGKTDEKERWSKATEYEERRASEEREKTFRRMEEMRRRRAEQER